MTNERSAYDALPNLNWSRLKLIERSPAHFQRGFGEDSSSFRLGTAAHSSTLEPAKFASDYIIFPGKRRQGKVWEEFEVQALKDGKQVLSAGEHTEALAIAKSVHDHPKAHSYLQHGAPEQTIVWRVSAGDILFDCKGRADYIGPAIVDLKSTKDGSPREFAKSCWQYGYYGQAAWYSDGHYLATGIRLPFVFIAVEKTPPYLVTVYRVPDAILEHGRNQYLTLLGKLDYCQRNNFWGGYSEADELDLTLPEWATNGGSN